MESTLIREGRDKKKSWATHPHRGEKMW
jgi:hypothetical protein